MKKLDRGLPLNEQPQCRANTYEHNNRDSHANGIGSRSYIQHNASLNVYAGRALFILRIFLYLLVVFALRAQQLRSLLAALLNHQASARWTWLHGRTIPHDIVTCRIAIASIKYTPLFASTFDQLAFFAFWTSNSGISNNWLRVATIREA